MQRRWGTRVAFGVGLCLALTACDAPPPGIAPTPRPKVQKPAPVPEPEKPKQPSLSAESRLLYAYYARVQADLQNKGLLRTDNGEADAPFTTRQLRDNFDAIALNDEYTSVNGEFVARTTRSNLHRWDVPVRIGLEFGETVPAKQQAKDRAAIATLVSKLTRATGHRITLSPRPNFHVLVVNEDERRALTPRLREMIPGLGEDAIRSVINMPRSSYCLVIAADPTNNGAYRNAVAVVRAEHPDLMRKSCFHEEIAQGLGLANDSPRARPSIFNDDEEFALLTHHDELLLRILYDPRLTPGMTPDTARPIVAEIASELMGGDS